MALHWSAPLEISCLYPITEETNVSFIISWAEISKHEWLKIPVVELSACLDAAQSAVDMKNDFSPWKHAGIFCYFTPELFVSRSQFG